MSIPMTYGNPRAQRIRVYYEGTDTLYEGSPVCYNYDTTSNWYGVDTYDNSESSTTTDGYQNEGKYLRVEVPSADNAEFFAGVVAEGFGGITNPGLIDIYVPNGAIVPVYTDKSITIKDPLYLEHGEITLVNATQVGMGVCVAEAVETVDRSSTAGVVLARLHEPSERTVYNGTLGIAPSEALWEDCPWEEIERNPGLGIVYFNDFMGTENLASGEGWTITQVTSGTMSLLAAEGGALHVDSGGHASADDGVQGQLLNCRFLPAAGKTIWFEARVKMNDATDQYYIGLAETDTTLIDGGVIDDASDKCGFFHHAASTDNKISCICSRADADETTANVADNTDGTYMTVGFRISGLTSVEFYVNGVLVETSSTTTKIPNSAMCLSVVAQVEATDEDAEMDIDWVKIAQLGARA